MMESAGRDKEIRAILSSIKTIAVVGASDKPERPSYRVVEYLLDKGYSIIPINPSLAGGSILGQKVYADLEQAPSPIQMVDIFRNSDAAGAIADKAVSFAEAKKIQVIWMQLGVRNNAAAARAEAAGLTVIMDRCPKIEHGRLFG